MWPYPNNRKSLAHFGKYGRDVNSSRGASDYVCDIFNFFKMALTKNVEEVITAKFSISLRL